MMSLDSNQQAFFALLRAGLWADFEFTHLRKCDFPKTVDWEKVYKLSEEQSVQGLVLQGIERLRSANVIHNLNQELLLQWIGEVQIIEQQNKTMNDFVAKIIDFLGKNNVNAILVKGQGIAQCYERPLWRSSGDVDLLLNEDDYKKAQKLLLSLADDAEEEDSIYLHQAMTMDQWVVELHGTLRSKLNKQIDSRIDAIQTKALCEERYRIWKNGQTDVKLPVPDDDVIFIFTHILQHYFRGGIGLRQICDWIRLIWTYRLDIDSHLLEKRLIDMGLISKWKSFSALAVEQMGMPEKSMPLYSNNRKWSHKAHVILKLVLESGNLGNGRDRSYKQKYPTIVGNLISFWVYSRYNILQFIIFPIDAVKGWWKMTTAGVIAAIKYKRN